VYHASRLSLSHSFSLSLSLSLSLPHHCLQVGVGEFVLFPTESIPLLILTLLPRMRFRTSD